MKMNISVPRALRERMKPFDNRANWSSIAAAAYAAAVDRMEQLGTVDDDVRKRMEADDLNDRERMHQYGERVGATWARRHARKINLRRLEAVHKHVEWSKMGADRLAQIALNDPSATWGNLPGDPDKPDAINVEYGYLDGFVDGAVSVLADL